MTNAKHETFSFIAMIEIDADRAKTAHAFVWDALQIGRKAMEDQERGKVVEIQLSRLIDYSEYLGGYHKDGQHEPQDAN